MNRQPHRSWWRCLTVLVAVALGVVFAACGGSSGGSTDGSATAGGRSGGTLSVAWSNEIFTQDPARGGYSLGDWWLYELAYGQLFDLNDDLTVKPELATAWKRESPTRYVFELRRGVRFSNGRTMTADDVVGSLERVLDPKNASLWAQQLGDVARIEASGPDEVTIVLRRPNAKLLPALASPSTAILPMKELKAGTFNPERTVLGTGPFQVANHLKDESWTFTRNPHYWRAGYPKVDRLDVKIIPDDSARLAAVRSGSVSTASFDRPDAVELLRSTPNVKTVVQETTQFYYLGVNAEPGSLLSDPKLRRALSLALDRDEIVGTALAGAGTPTAASPASFGVCDPKAMPYAKPDLDAARKLVSDAGAEGKSVTIIAPTSISSLSQVAQVLQQNFSAIGLKAKVLQLEQGTVVKRVYSGKPDFDLIVNVFPSYADPSMALIFWNPTASAFVKGWVQPDQQLNELVAKSETTSPGAARDSEIRGACERIAEDGNLIPLVSKTTVVAYRPDLVHARIQPLEGYTVTMRHAEEFTR